eukprot:202438-Chlamydomonas_euryale.AAC.3
MPAAHTATAALHNPFFHLPARLHTWLASPVPTPTAAVRSASLFGQCAPGPRMLLCAPHLRHTFSPDLALWQTCFLCPSPSPPSASLRHTFSPGFAFLRMCSTSEKT